MAARVHYEIYLGSRGCRFVGSAEVGVISAALYETFLQSYKGGSVAD